MLVVEGVFPGVARRLVQDHDWDTIANQYKWHAVKLSREYYESPGGVLTSSIKHNNRPPAGHPDNKWFREENPYQYLGEVTKSFSSPARGGGGGRKARRTASKGEKTAAAIVPGGLHFGAKHGKLSKEKAQHRDKIGLKDESGT